MLLTSHEANNLIDVKLIMMFCILQQREREKPGKELVEKLPLVYLTPRGKCLYQLFLFSNKRTKTRNVCAALI